MGGAGALTENHVGVASLRGRGQPKGRGPDATPPIKPPPVCAACVYWGGGAGGGATGGARGAAGTAPPWRAAGARRPTWGAGSA